MLPGECTDLEDAKVIILSLNKFRIKVNTFMKICFESWAGHVARMEEAGSTFKILTAKRPSGKPKQKWEDNINGS